MAINLFGLGAASTALDIAALALTFVAKHPDTGIGDYQEFLASFAPADRAAAAQALVAAGADADRVAQALGRATAPADRLVVIGAFDVPWYVTAASVAGGVAGAYHGYRRNKSVGWAVAWGLLGSVFPLVVVPVAVSLKST